MYSEKDIQKLGELKKQCSTLKKKRISIRRTLEKSDKQIESIEKTIEDISSIWIFYNGIPLSKREDRSGNGRLSIRNVPENNRYAEIYHNANAEPKENVWGCELRSYGGELGPLGGKCLGANLTLEEAQELACEWVTNGIVKEKG
ncbi:MAG: hypothetical protein WC998_08690 [Candidatus Paceibacterota bacterium]|jgi:hypothetical protein